MKDTFKKEYQILPTPAVEAVVEKYEFLNDQLPDELGIVVPEVVASDESSITFKELPLDDMTSLHQYMHTAPTAKVAQAFSLVGERLAVLHDVLQEKEYVHGDMWPGNVFLNKDEITIIDFEPTTRTAWEESIHNEVESDLAKFITVGETLFPHGNMWHYPLNRAQWYEAFLFGYSQAGGSFDEVKLFCMVRDSFRRKFPSLITDTERSMPNRCGALLFRGVTWACNPMLRGKVPNSLLEDIK